MKTILTPLLMLLFLWTTNSLYAQVGIGTTTPDASSILDITSTTQGILMPRLTSIERDAVTLPATGLMIFNTTLNGGQINTGTPAIPDWIAINPPSGPMINSVTESGAVSTTSTSDVLVSGMTLSPAAGTYLILFNAQLASAHTFGSSQGVIDAANLYDELIAFPGGVAHGLTFGSGETLLAGVYDVAGAPSIAGTLTMDGGGDPDAVFIIRGTGAFTTGIGTNVILTGGTSSENIFWVSNAAMSTGANTTLKGTMLGGGTGAGAVSLGADSDLDGRLFTKLGAVTLGANVILTAPTGTAPVTLGDLSTLAMWSSSGAVSDAASSITTGDAGTGAGVLTMTGTQIGVEYPAGTASTQATTTFSIYQNSIEVASSSRTTNVSSAIVSLQAMLTVAAGQLIEIMWKIDDGQAQLNLRTLTLLQSQSQN
jgi:hypothetical protein